MRNLLFALISTIAFALPAAADEPKLIVTPDVCQLVVDRIDLIVLAESLYLRAVEYREEQLSESWRLSNSFNRFDVYLQYERSYYNKQIRPVKQKLRAAGPPLDNLEMSLGSAIQLVAKKSEQRRLTTSEACDQMVVAYTDYLREIKPPTTETYVELKTIKAAIDESVQSLRTQTLECPEEVPPTHTIESDDSLRRITEKYCITIEQLYELNEVLHDTRRLITGTELRLR